MKQHLQAIVTVLSLVNPLICGAMFAQIESGQDRGKQLADATKIALSILVILTAAALVGVRVLQIFGISLQAFSVAGGGVLIWIGSSMGRVAAPAPGMPRSRAEDYSAASLWAASTLSASRPVSSARW